MKWKKPGLWLGIASLLLVVGFVAWDSKRISAGELSAVHARARADLENDCAACHATGEKTMAAACAGCHEDVARGIEARTGLHGTMTAEVAACGTCHSEHHGSDHALVSDHAFALAGITNRKEFRHESLAFDLVGDHVDAACEICHEHANDAVLVSGTKRFLGESQACATCHRDPHDGHLPECASCHGQSEPFATVASFQHPDSFALSGRHAGVGCLECHPRHGEFAIEASGITGGKNIATRATRACVDCHASPHEADFVAAVAKVLSVDVRASCESCHPTENGSFQGPSARMDKAMHALTGFALDPPHADATCAQCHATNPLLPKAPTQASALEQFRALHPGRRADECKACHVDPHGGQFSSGLFAEANCRACHEATRFVPADFGLSEHARTSFALTGAHEAVACSNCHEQPSPDAPRAFHGTSTDCSSCHVDAHAAFFDRAEVPALFNGESGCARCHDTSTFGPVKTRSFDHELWTGFELAGAHARGACTDCHVRSKVVDPSGRTFGRVADIFEGPTSECATCHADVHAGHFKKRAGVKDTGCAHCHDVERFDAARSKFAHDEWTGFALTGSHARAECEVCHVPRERPDVDGRRFGLVSEQFPGPSDRCETCHVDVHAGKFASSGCASCHTTESFHNVPSTSFDHARATGFALVGEHAAVECAACHAPNETAQGRTFGRAKGTSCQSCHADPHVGQFTEKGATDCARCHSASAPFDQPHFDHARDSKFALDETHIVLECASCHIPTPLKSGGSAIRYKPLGTQCADCHAPGKK